MTRFGRVTGARWWRTACLGIGVGAVVVALTMPRARASEVLPSPESRGPMPPLPASEAPLNSSAIERSGLRQLGFGLEAPIVGVMTDFATGRFTYGYTLGGALSWEIVPSVLVRAYGSLGRTFGARPHLAYTQSPAPATASGVGETVVIRRQDASWYGVELGLGAAYLWRDPASDLTPYLGLDGGAVFAGYEYDFSHDDPLTQQDTTSGVPTSGNDAHAALAWSWIATVRAGMRMSLLRWLATQAELDVSYVPIRGHAVANTYTALGAHSLPENVLLVRTVFTMRLGL